MTMSTERRHLAAARGASPRSVLPRHCYRTACRTTCRTGLQALSHHLSHCLSHRVDAELQRMFQRPRLFYKESGIIWTQGMHLANDFLNLLRAYRVLIKPVET